METYSVKLMTDNGEITYPDYRREKGSFTGAGNAKVILFTPYNNGQSAAFVTSVVLESGGVEIAIPADFRVGFGDVVKFPANTLKTDSATATPVIQRGVPYIALVGTKLALTQLIGDTPIYAQQKLPESADPFTAIHLLSSGRDSEPYAKTWDGDYRVYHYNCTAQVIVIRSSDDAQAFLEHFMYRADSTEGEFWQFDNNFIIDRSGDFENSSPLIANLVYQQMAQVTLSLQFVYQHYERERWIDSATVEKGNKVTVVTKGA
ncbi:TPA: hypothetical protein R6W18_002846 [Citrobacter braakii]|nr:hypothetical protein [Citrobacter braakii]HEE9823269.1 hypothetical protein [Citrobacter braakii]